MTNTTCSTKSLIELHYIYLGGGKRRGMETRKTATRLVGFRLRTRRSSTYYKARHDPMV